MRQDKESKSINQAIDTIRNSYGTQVELLQEVLKAGDGALYGVDLMVIAVIHRSIALCDGFVMVVERDNYLCANALLRLQIDSIMRLYSCWLVDNPDDVAIKLLKGITLNRIKSFEGDKLSDSYLRKKINSVYPWVNRVYKKTSGYVHLSAPHLQAPFYEINKTNRSMSMAVGIEGGRKWSQKDKIDTLGSFLQATLCLMHLCNSWKETKSLRNVAK